MLGLGLFLDLFVFWYWGWYWGCCCCCELGFLWFVFQALAILETKTKEIEKSVRLNKEVVKEGTQINRRNIADEIKPLLA